MLSSSYNHNTLTTLRTSVKEPLQMHYKATVRNFHALNSVYTEFHFLQVLPRLLISRISISAVS